MFSLQTTNVYAGLPLKGTLALRRCASELAKTEEIAGIRITPAERLQAEERASEMVDRILALVNDPAQINGIVDVKDLDFSLNSAAIERASNFTRENNLIERRKTAVKSGKDEIAKFKGDVGKLIEYVGRLEKVTSGKMGLIRVMEMVRRIPGSSYILPDDSANSIMNIKEQIETIDQSLLAGIDMLANANADLATLYDRTIDEAQLLAQDTVVVELVRRELEARSANLPAHQKQIVRDEFLFRILSHARDQKTLLALMMGAPEVIVQTIAINEETMTEARRLRFIAQPALAISESINEASRQARLEMLKNAAVRKTTEGAVRNIQTGLAAANIEIAALMKESIVPTETLRQLISGIARERGLYATRVSQIYEGMVIDNAKLEPILQQAQLLLERQAGSRAIEGRVIEGRPN